MRRLLVVLFISVLPGAVFPGVAAAEFGLVPGSTAATASDGGEAVELQAGAHPADFSLRFAIRTQTNGHTEGGSPRDAVVTLPAGFYGNPTSVPTCSQQQFEGEVPHCPGYTQIGVIRANITGLGEIIGPVFNVEAPPGAAAEFGFKSSGFVARQYATVDPADGYAVQVTAPNFPLELSAVNETIWGTPADPSHDAERTCLNPSGVQYVGCSSSAAVQPFLTLPSSCSGVPQTTVAVDSKLAPGIFASETVDWLDVGGNPAPMVGCEAVPFEPRVGSAPTTQEAESAAGLAFNLKLANSGLLQVGGITETEPEKTEVVLPSGMTINPSAATGIVGCTEAQYAEADGSSARGCPEASKIGTLVARSPLLSEPIEGAVYLAQPHENQFGTLLGLYIVALAKERGVLIKQAGKVEADEVTGQLTTTFDALPSLPYSAFEFHLREGPRAPLISPSTCGEYRTTAKLYPFSVPGAATVRYAPFAISSGANSGPCASSESQLPLAPTLEAGTVAPVAGSYSPFVFRLRRPDGDQRISSVSATLPTGLLGRIAGTPYCPDSGIAQAAARGQEGGGTLEVGSPSCPAGSQVGVVNVEAGAGPSPYLVQGKVYLAGPYKGAPLSLEIITPAIAGPFDLGSVAVRTALYVNELTAQITAISDPLPSILHGIPLDVRTISLEMTRPQFTLNPTGCQAKAVLGSVAGLAGKAAAVSTPFAVGGCSGLPFKPSLKLSFDGQTKRLGHPAVKAVLTQPAGGPNANLADATVILPKGMFIDQSHVSGPCTRVQYNAGTLPGEKCPAKSILGTAKVWTPLLEQPEEGKVYFRSNGGERELPDMVVALRGQIPLQLVGFIDSVGKKHAEVRRVRSRFLNLPDAPVSRFELKLSGGKKGLLINSKNLCSLSGRAKMQLRGQNGSNSDTEPKVQVACGKGGRRHRAK
jgi:hypothetical protein